MFEGRLNLIRPLMDLDERMLIEYADLNDLVKVEMSCPQDKSTSRANIAHLIYNMFKSMGKIFEEYLPSQYDP